MCCNMLGQATVMASNFFGVEGKVVSLHDSLPLDAPTEEQKVKELHTFLSLQVL